MTDDMDEPLMVFATEGVCSQGVSVNMTPSVGSDSSAGWHKTGETEECAAERWRAGSRTDNNESFLMFRIMENTGVPDRRGQTSYV